MLEVLKHDGRGRQVRHQLDNLPVPFTADGELAHKMDGSALYKLLAKAKVPGIAVNMGKQALLVAYSTHLRETMPDCIVNGVLNVPPKPAPKDAA